MGWWSLKSKKQQKKKFGNNPDTGLFIPDSKYNPEFSRQGKIEPVPDPNLVKAFEDILQEEFWKGNLGLLDIPACNLKLFFNQTATALAGNKRVTIKYVEQ